jgi:hypothetical protein
VQRIPAHARGQQRLHSTQGVGVVQRVLASIVRRPWVHPCCNQVTAQVSIGQRRGTEQYRHPIFIVGAGVCPCSQQHPRRLRCLDDMERGTTSAILAIHRRTIV